MVLLVTSDNEQFTTDRDIVERSVLIKNMLEGPTSSCLQTIADSLAFQMLASPISQFLFPMSPPASLKRSDFSSFECRFLTPKPGP